jgi:hypothetical protein
MRPVRTQFLLQKRKDITENELDLTLSIFQ